MSIKRQFVEHFLLPALKPLGFRLENRSLVAAPSKEVRVAFTVQEYSWKAHYTLNMVFYSPYINLLLGIDPGQSPDWLTSFAFRPREIEVPEPSQGWHFRSGAELSEQGPAVVLQIIRQVTPLIAQLSTLDGWDSYCRAILASQKCGRGKFWTILVYAMLVNSRTKTDSVHDALISHASESDNPKHQNKLPIQIARQREFLLARQENPTAFFERFGGAKVDG